MPLMQPMVGAFAVVCGVKASNLRPALEKGINGCFNLLKGLIRTWSRLQSPMYSIVFVGQPKHDEALIFPFPI